MVDFAISNAAARGNALARVAEATLRSLGGDEVQLRLPQPLTAGPLQGLGKNTPVMQDVSVAPAVVRPLDAAADGRKRFEVLFPASVIQQQVEMQQFPSAVELFEAVAGIVSSGKLLRVESIASQYFGATAYLYRVTVVE